MEDFYLQVPATREVLASLPNVFTALCLNSRGLEAFVQCQPFERILKVTFFHFMTTHTTNKLNYSPTNLIDDK